MADTYPYAWDSRGIKYLGITLTPTTANLCKANYTPFLDKLRSKLRDMAKVELSWLGRLAAFKMTVLPQLIYLFRMLPIPVIPVPNYFFSTAQSAINKYLWQGKKARCAFSKLVMTRRVGGGRNGTFERLLHSQSSGSNQRLVPCFHTDVMGGTGEFPNTWP